MASGYSRLGNDTQNYGTIQPAVDFAQGSSTEFFQVCFIKFGMNFSN